ncbi:MAG: hypothetical protein IJH32_02580 [Ruminococcus sp.]|nr:hypothetical protein [Ruminococcus sp.]
MSDRINELALSAAKDSRIREELITQQEQTILRTASKACRKYITKSDDEWSIALCAFSKAIDVYAEDKGNFLPFAQMLIKRALVDWYRKQKNVLSEVPVAPHILEGGGEPDEDIDGVYFSVIKASKEKSDNSLKEEILSANDMLMQYGFRFFDLTECSPQQDRTRSECAVAIRYMLDQYPPELLEELKRKHKLPVKSLAEGSGVSKKTIDRYRKYLIMAVIILEGDFPHIAEYMKFVRKEESV